MKTEGQVRHKLQQVTYRHLQRAIRTSLSRRPENCVHNMAAKLPRGELRFCTLCVNGCKTRQSCDEAHGGLEQAGRCVDFKRSHTKESVKEAFVTFLRTANVAEIAVEYPDIVALMWVLDVEGAYAATDLDIPEQDLDTSDPLDGG